MLSIHDVVGLKFTLDSSHDTNRFFVRLTSQNELWLEKKTEMTLPQLDVIGPTTHRISMLQISWFFCWLNSHLISIDTKDPTDCVSSGANTLGCY